MVAYELKQTVTNKLQIVHKKFYFKIQIPRDPPILKEIF